MLVKVRVFLLLFFFCVLSFSQNTEIKTLSGEVVNNDIEKSGIVIINKSTGGTTITDKEGFFRIGVRLKDSLFFRSVQIKAHFVYINEEVYKSDSIRVFLDVKVNELKNVDVTPYNLSGSLLADANKVNKKEIFNFDDVNIPGFKGERKEKIVYKNNSQILLNVLLLPLMPLDIEGMYKQLSGYYKNLKIARGLEKQYGGVVSIIQFYGSNYFMERYNLKEEEVYEFVLGASENYDLLTDFKNSNHGLILNNLDKFYESINN